MFNPDYPTTSGGFLQHTYQPIPNVNESFYYSGIGSINPFNNQMNNLSDSRRMMSGYPTMPQQNVNTGEQQLMPFSSYPPATPQPTPAFNALVESRRNTNVATPQQANVNPWANPMPATPIQPAPQTPVYPQYPQQMNPMIPMNCNVLYGNGVTAFDRKAGCWDNIYTNPNPTFAPTIDWRNAQQQSAPTYPNPAQTYPVAQYPQTNASWLEIAEKNWGRIL